jgi:hypothetical protein
LPTRKKTLSRLMPSAISYEIICAPARSPPSSAYLLELAQPAITMPYTPSEEKASRKSTPTGTSAITIGTSPQGVGSGAAKGITAKVTIAGMIESIGARMKNDAVRLARVRLLLEDVLQPVGERLQQAARAHAVGPERSCIQALTFRSSSVSIATITRTPRRRPGP